MANGYNYLNMETEKIKTFDEILKKEWEKVTRSPFDDTTRKHLNYVYLAAEEYRNQPQQKIDQKEIKLVSTIASWVRKNRNNSAISDSQLYLELACKIEDYSEWYHKYAISQQPAVMPSEELYQALKNCVIELEQIRDGIAFTPSEGRISRAAEAIKKYELSLSKEAPKERMPNVGETIKETAIEFAEWISSNGFTWGDSFLWVSNLIEYSGCVYTSPELFDLFKQRK